MSSFSIILFLTLLVVFNLQNITHAFELRKPYYDNVNIQKSICANSYSYLKNIRSNLLVSEPFLKSRWIGFPLLGMLKNEGVVFDVPELISTPPTVENSAKTDSEAWIARIILLTVSAFYGTNFGCVKILGEALNPGVAAVLRFSIASLVFSPYLFKVAQNNKKLVYGGLEIGLYSAIGYYAQAQSLQTSQASTTAFICSLAVIVVPILNLIFEKTNKSFGSIMSSLFPAILAAAGVASLELGGSELPGIGDLWAFLQPLFFGLGFWRIEKHIKMCTKEGDAQAFTGAMMSVVLIFIYILFNYDIKVAVFSIIWTSHDFILPLYSSGGVDSVMGAIHSQLEAAKDWKVLAALMWTGVVTTALTSYGENIAMQSLDAAESTVIYSTEPLWGTVN